MHSTTHVDPSHDGPHHDGTVCSGTGHLRAGADIRALLRRAFAGESLALERDDHSLHDLTQVALALKPHATLTLRFAATMTPIERASIASVGKGRVVFL